MRATSIPQERTESRFRVWTVLSGMLLTLALAGCEIPTEAPILESRWVVPAEETTVGVDEFLPTGVSLTPDETAFVVTVDPVLFNETLGNLCPACVLVNGFTVPKPAFSGNFQSVTSLPADVSSVTLQGGSVVISLTNGLNFDPLRPGVGVFGSLTIQLTDGADGDLLGSLQVLGQDSAFAPAATQVLTMPLNAGTLNGDLEVLVTVDSPEGDPILMDTAMRMDADATPQNITVSSATVDVAGEQVNVDPVALDVEDIDEDLSDRVVRGAFNIAVDNPFGVGASATLVIDGPTILPIQKSIAISADPTSSLVVEFTGNELQSFLGQTGVTLSGSATVDPGAADATVTPGMEITLDADLDLTIEIGG